VGDDEYEYTPHINCEKSIVSSAEDALLLHYSFDDFQEPTVNIVKNPSGSMVASGVPGSYKPGWDVTLHPEAITVSSWSTGYNSGVPSPSIGYHAKWVYKNGDNTDPVMLFTDKNNEYGLGHRWLGINQRLSTPTSHGLAVGDKVTISWNQKADTLGRGAETGLHHTLLSTGATSFGANKGTVKVKQINKWERVSFTSTIDSDWDFTKNFSLYFYGHTGNYGKLWVDDIQVEKKSYATPFVNGSRAGIVQDNSVNNKDATLDVSLSPKWVEDAILGDGAYQFDGTNKYIMSDSEVSLSGNQTISCWINPTATNGLKGLVSLHKHSTTSNLGLNLNDGKLSISIGYTDGTREFSNKLSKATIPTNEWTYAVLTYNQSSNKVSLYINGKLDSEFTLTKTVKFESSKVLIGQWSLNYLGNYMMSGRIDDVRIYNRTLSSTEIENYYKIITFDD
jgi:hypothetical protein